MNFYVAPPYDTTTLQQGDLLENVPFTYFSLVNAQVTLTDGQGELRDLSQNVSGVDAVTAKVVFGWGAVLTQTCDLQGHKPKPILIARVRPIRELVSKFNDSTPKNAVSAVSELANPGKTPSLFYLPAYEAEGVSFPKSGADLLDVHSFLPSDLPTLTRLAKLRLSGSALQALQERYAYCLGRFAAPDDLFFSPDEWAEAQRQQQTRLQSQVP